MNQVAEQILSEALQMPTEDRASMAQRLIASLDDVTDEGVEIAWQQEVNRRLAEAESGKVAFLSWEEVRQQLRGNSCASR